MRWWWPEASIIPAAIATDVLVAGIWQLGNSYRKLVIKMGDKKCGSKKGGELERIGSKMGNLQSRRSVI
jgi:hypothetical protein